MSNVVLGNKSTVMNNRVYMILPAQYTLTAGNISDYIPIFGSGPGVSGGELVVRSNIGKRLYIEELWGVASSNTKDGTTDMRFRINGVNVMEVAWPAGVSGIQRSTTLVTGPGIIEPDDLINFEFSATASTAGNIRINGVYMLCYYLTQEVA